MYSFTQYEITAFLLLFVKKIKSSTSAERYLPGVKHKVHIFWQYKTNRNRKKKVLKNILYTRKASKPTSIIPLALNTCILSTFCKIYQKTFPMLTNKPRCHGPLVVNKTLNRIAHIFDPNSIFSANLKNKKKTPMIGCFFPINSTHSLNLFNIVTSSVFDLH